MASPDTSVDLSSCKEKAKLDLSRDTSCFSISADKY
jgi:hypothetical protein